MRSKEQAVQHFLDLIKRSRRGKFKIYIGMSAGVGKTYRMLQEAHALLSNGIDVKIGYIETHNRKETHALLEGLPVIPRRKLFYKGKELEELDLIDRYLKDQQLPAEPDEAGIYHMFHKLSDGTPVEAGRRVRVTYTGSFLDGRSVDIREKPLEFVYGTPDQVVDGLNIVIGGLKQGESAKIILPSRLAFGEKGSANGSIPPYSPLVYEIKVLEVK